MMFDQFQNRFAWTGTLTAQTALRIGAGRATGVTGTDLPVVRDALGKPYIPGSSFKGALRAYVESLVRGVSSSRKAACNPVGGEADWCLSRPGELTDQQVEAETCLVCRVFGSHWLAARVSIRDLPVDETLWYGQFEYRNGVAIDRDTEAAAGQLLYDFEVVPAGTRFHCRIVAENMEPWQLGLLAAGLRPFEQGDAALGGARSRGLGVVKIDWKSRTRTDAGNLLEVLVGEQEPAEITGEDMKAWIGALRGELARVGGESRA
jgi:CRISPR-associated RAMP protein (TIGR02581 family)